MKKLILLFAITIVLFSNSNLKAQNSFEGVPDASQYDLLYIFDTTYFSNCFLSNNGLNHIVPTLLGGHYQTLPHYADMYAKHNYFLPYYNLWCDSTAPSAIDGYVIGATKRNDSVYAEAFAQEYLFEQLDIPYNDYIICGVSIRIGESSRHQWGNFAILDENFDTLSTTTFHTDNLGPNTTEIIPWNRDGWNNYYFPQRDYARLTNLTNFHLAFNTDEEKYQDYSYFHVIHTCNVYSPCLRDSIYANGGPYNVGLSYDTIMPGLIAWPRLYNWRLTDYNFGGVKDSITGDWISSPHPSVPDGNMIYESLIEFIKTLTPEDYIPLCSFTNPKHIRRYGEWVDFVDDPAYTIWQNIYIAMVPIIMIPSNTQSLSEAELQKMCYLFPNPTQDYFKVMSHYTIESVQVYDMVGKLVLEKSVNNFETGFDASNFSSGSYIVKINTAKGEVKKKLIVE